MNKTGFIFSCMATLIGVVTLLITSYTNSILPNIGYLVFKASGGSYNPSDYNINFVTTNIIAILMILIGIAISILLYLREQSVK